MEETQKNISGTAVTEKMLDINEIKKAIPHRYPFLLVDKIKIIEDYKRAIGYKYVTMNEWYFQGHFPDRPVMPGVLIIEAMAQTACAVCLSHPEFQNKIAFFMGIHEAKFRKPVLPGSLLEMYIDVLKAGGRAGKVRGEAKVDGEIVAESEFTFAMVDK